MIRTIAAAGILAAAGLGITTLAPPSEPTLVAEPAAVAISSDLVTVAEPTADTPAPADNRDHDRKPKGNNR